MDVCLKFITIIVTIIYDSDTADNDCYYEQYTSIVKMIKTSQQIFIDVGVLLRLCCGF